MLGGVDDTRAAAERWAATWRNAWEAHNPEPIVALYAPGSTFSSEPFREPYLGREGVREYVRRTFAEEREPRVWMADPIVDGSRAAISWWATLVEDGIPTTLAGTSVLRFDTGGLVTEQWDAWNVLPTRRAPPSGWSPLAESEAAAEDA